MRREESSSFFPRYPRSLPIFVDIPWFSWVFSSVFLETLSVYFEVYFRSQEPSSVRFSVLPSGQEPFFGPCHGLFQRVQISTLQFHHRSIPPTIAGATPLPRGFIPLNKPSCEGLKRMGQLSDPWGPFVPFSYPLGRHWNKPLFYITLAWCRSSFGGASLSLRHVWKWPPVRHTLDIDLSGTAGPGLGGSGVEHCIVTTLVLPKVSFCAGRTSCFAWKLWIKFLLSLVHFVHTVLTHKYPPYWLHVVILENLSWWQQTMD